MTKKKEARQIHIQKILLERTKVKISDLAKELNVTPETLRNDLNEMENLSLLVREHGYARVISSSFETPLTMRNRENPEDKRRITFRAFQEIKDGQIVYLDSGSTVLLGANALQMKKDITVVTNSIPLLTHCIAMNINTIVCGGFLFNTGARTYGHFAANIIDHLHIDVAIMGTDGILDSNIEYKNKELWVKYLLEDIEVTNPQKIADIILNESVDNNFGKIKDDMSVVVCKFIKKI